MSLRARLALSLGLIVVVFMTVVGIGTAVSARDAAIDSVDRILLETADNLADRESIPLQNLADVVGLRNNATSAGGRGRGTSNRFGTPDRSSVRFTVVLADGRSIFVNENQPLPIDDAVLDVAREQGPREVRTVKVDGREARMLVAPAQLPTRDGPQPGAIAIARFLEDFDQVRDNVIRQIAVWGAIGTLLAAAVGWLLSRGLTRPIEELTATSEAVAETQDLSRRIDVTTDDEVGRLGRSFNTMLDALQVSRRQQHQLVQDANHELRTPLTSMRTNIELLQRNPNIEPEMRGELLGDITSELGELTLLVEELVASATDVTASPESTRELDFAMLVEGVAERARRRSGRTIELEITGTTDIVGREAMLERAVSNLVGNAVKFSPADSPILVRLDGPRVEVHDGGPGIPAAERDQVFERFYRSTEARSQPGSGLGLSIVRQVATAHGGEPFVGESATGGALVGFEIDPNLPPS